MEESANGNSLHVQARQAEQAGKTSAAICLYKQLVARSYNEYAFNRLMILYRKGKQYAQEIATARRAIRALQQHLSHRRKRLSGKAAHTSKALLRSLGLTDRKGNSLYQPDPMPRWIKRITTAEKKRLK
jgi:hypothetical protein